MNLICLRPSNFPSDKLTTNSVTNKIIRNTIIVDVDKLKWESTKAYDIVAIQSLTRI